jgi:hypothetical protein
MKAFLSIFCLLIAGMASVVAQKTPVAAKPKALKKQLELKMPKTAEDNMCGIRGACVAWHPVQKKYYAAFAGNAAYPMAVFDNKGKRLSNEEQACMIDTRGLWYDAAAKTIAGNGYDQDGWFAYTIGKDGLPTGYNTIAEGMNQPRDQSVGALNHVAGKVMFLKGSMIYGYDKKTVTLRDSMMLYWGRTLSEGAGNEAHPNETPEAYNSTSIIYTGMVNAEIGVLNTWLKRIELYNAKTGFLTRSLQLPDNAPVNETFGFAAANGCYWLFDTEKRTWYGYK